jgi:hypothetical protein
LRPGTDFADQAAKFMIKTLNIEITNILRKYRIPDKDATLIANNVTAAFAAHAQGDEDRAFRPLFNKDKLSPWGRFIYSRQKHIVEGLWQNPGPPDLNLTLDLSQPG